jgi:type IV secretory pathway VirB10-like protein
MAEPHTPDTSLSPGRVFDQRRLPPGVVPRHLQQWALIGTALVMVGILAISGPPPAPRPTAPPSPAGAAVDPNQQRIEDYQRRIQEQAQRLAAEQAQLQLTKEALAADAGDGLAARRPVNPATRPMPAMAAPQDPREDRARFVDSVAFNRPDPIDAGVRAHTTTLDPALASLVAPPLAAPSSLPGLPGLPGGAAAPTAPTSSASPSREPRQANATGVSVGSGGPRYTLFEGTFIDTVLTNRLDGTFNGPVNCLVSVPVYAADHLVIPAGARVLGEARAVSSFGQSRLAVTFHRVLFPNGEDLSLDQFQGLNQVGDLGLHDHVDRHYAQVFGVSIALGIIGGLAQGRSAVGLDATGVDTYRQGVAASVAQSSTRVLDRFLNLLPTVTIREGHRVKVILSQDLSLPAYAFGPIRGGRS